MAEHADLIKLAEDLQAVYEAKRRAHQRGVDAIEAARKARELAADKEQK